MKRKIKKFFLELISNTKILNIFFNEIVNDQDFTKLTGGRDKGENWTTSNTVVGLLQTNFLFYW